MLRPFLLLQAGDTETYRCELTMVHSKLEPWEKQLIEHRKKFDVAYAEHKLLDEKVRLLY